MADDLVSMALTADSKMKSMELPIAMTEKPEWPYGLCLSFTDEEMSKLDIDPAEAIVGQVFMMRAECRITCVSANDSENGSSFRMEARIERMSVGDDEPDEDDAPKSRSAKLYDGM